jgi:hypothetical protein
MDSAKSAALFSRAERAMAATTLSLTADEMTKLDEVSKLPPEYPGWMVMRQSAERRPQPK